MEQTVWKYTLEWTDNVEVDMPRGAEIVYVGVQRDTLCLWCLVWPEVELVKRNFRIAGTGHLIEADGKLLEHLGSVLLADGSLVFHVFEVSDPLILPYED